MDDISIEEDVDVADMASERELRRQRMKEFYQLSHILFTKPERLILYKILKDYKRRCDLDRLILGLSLVLRTYTKLELLKYVRYFLWEGHLPEFDRATKFHHRFRPRRNHGDRVQDPDVPRAGPSHLQVPDGQSMGSTNTRGSGATTSSTRHFKDVRVFTLHKPAAGSGGLGFSVRGGSEHGLGIYVSEIEPDSAAERSGLEVGDKILEANNISLRGVASSSAVRVLTGSARLKLVIQRTRKVPEWRLSREKTSWYDVHVNRLISGEFEECGISHHIRGLDVDMPERRVSLKFEKGEKTLGFNIRGGREYGLGIYVSKLDKGGPADKNGVRVGDQIIDVNGIPFENITHAHAVEVMKGKQHLILTLRDVGRFPVYKELYAEYTWSEGQLKAASSVTSLRDVHFEKEGVPTKALSVSDIFTRQRRPSSLQNEIFLPKKPPRHNLNKDIGQLEEVSNPESDSESLINIEQWTGHMGDDGTENNGYISDNEDGVVHVEVINTDERGDIILESRRRDIMINSDDVIYDVTNELEELDGGLYAKINKHNDKIIDVNEYMKKENSLLTSEQVHDTHEQHVFDVYGSAVDVHRGSKHSSVNSFNEDTQEPDNKDNYGSHKPEGALYHRVRRSSAYSNFGQPKAGTSKSDIVNTNDRSTSREQTLQIRSFSHTVDDSDESDEESTKGAKRKGFSQTYSFQTDETEDASYTIQSEDGKVSHTRLEPSVERTRASSENLSVVHSEDGKLSRTRQDPSVERTSASEGVVLNDDGQLSRARLESHVERSRAGSENFSVEDLEVRLRELEKRQTSLGMNELNSLSPKHDNGSEPKMKKGKWKNFKDKVKGSLRIKSSGGSKTGTLRKGVLLERRENTIDSYNMASLEEAARKMLNTDEFDAVMRHVKYYHGTHELDRLVETLLDILDQPEKLLLLRDIRGVVYPLDMAQFDHMVNAYEIEAYQKLSMKLHLPLVHKPQRRPRKTLMTAEIDLDGEDAEPDSGTEDDPDATQAENGHFHIRPMYQYKKEEEIVQAMREDSDELRQGSPLRQVTSPGELRQGSPLRQVTSLSELRQGSPLRQTPAPGELRQGSPLRQVTGSPLRRPLRQRSSEEASVMGQFDYLDTEHGDDNLSIIVSSDQGSYGSSEVERTPGAVTVHLSKTKPEIGLELEEVMEHGLRDVRVHKILPHGAADDDSTIQVGMSLLAVDSHRVEGCTAAEALAILQKSYSDKHMVSMKLVLHKAQMTHF